MHDAWVLAAIRRLERTRPIPRISSWSAAAFVAVVGALAEAVFFARVPLLYRASTRSVA